ncbi:MAG TPA: O-antigen ligase family protein, partial [candidate division Zixibacteria bacterium]|nr:O-antigen ligase family protein [candidate division Zixibacteria bacterium]
AGVLMLLLPLALALFLQVKNWTRVFYLIATISMAIMLFLTQSRNAYLGVFFAIIAGLLWGRIRFRFVMLFVAFLLVMPFAAVGLSINGELGGSDLISTVDMSTKAGSSLDQSWLSRLEIWSAAVQTMGDYPVVGAGLYTFAPVSRANYVYQVLFPNIDISHAHNLFLQTGASLGWAGWLAIAGLWVSVMYALWGAQESDPASNRWLPRALSAGIAGYIVFNSFDVLALEQWAGITVWLVLALASAVIERSGFKAGRYRWL